MTNVEATFTDDAGTVRLEGRISGDLSPTDFELLNGGFAAIGNGAEAPIPWSHSDQSSLLDLAAPLAPVVIDSGVYAFAVSVSAAGLTVGGYFELTLQLDATGLATNQSVDSRAAIAADQNPIAAVAATYYLAAGEGIAARVRNKDGAATRSFNILSAVVQRVS